MYASQVRGFYRGLGFPLLTAGALNSIFFGVYGNCLSHIQQLRGYENTRRTSSEGGVCNKHWYLDVWLAGSVAGFVQLSLACPVDLVKIKLQTQTGKTWGSNPELGFRGPLECLSSTYRNNGVRGLYRGLPVMMWRDIPTFGLYMVVYETAQSLFKPISNQNTESHVVSQLIAGGGAGRGAFVK
uniref:Mitochondrial carrier protein n=1 Tax=Timema bartmani TaxID=61472 RepID=A0A7R9EN83_9NEOP|nr:unnamed protein product [Timema bartmani]